MKNSEQSVDIFRDTYLRYLGYANEVGEAFRSIVPKSIVLMTYVVASSYVVADAIHKGRNEYMKNDNKNKNKRIILSTSDTLVWQSFASVIIPGLTINRICAGVIFLQKRTRYGALKSPWISTAIGLASIPLIIHPIDSGVDAIMNSTYRQWTGYHPQEHMIEDR